MTALLLKTKNKTDLQLFKNLAKRVGVEIATLSDEDILDAGLLDAMNEAKKTKFVSKQTILKNIKTNAG
ncbi:MAG: hypothetical protein ACOCWB_08685 [Bacteroidota bacterium]